MFSKKKSDSTKHLENAIKSSTSDRILIQDIMEAMNAGGFGLVLMFFSLPVLIPLPPPFPSLFSIPAVIFSLQMMLGLKAPKLPKYISQKTIKRSLLAKIVEDSSVHINRIESFLKPRLVFLSSGIFERIIGFFIFIFSLFILLPIPLSNFLPGIGILIISFGLIGKDGVVIIIGLLVGLIGITVATAALFIGASFAVAAVKKFILTYFH